MRFIFSKKNMRYILLLFPVLLILSSCVKNNPQPVWLEINERTLQSNPNATDEQGEMTHNFSDVWVYVDNKVIGVFELPCKIPVLVSGAAKVQLYPTVRNNGIASTKKLYPFVEAFVDNSLTQQRAIFGIVIFGLKISTQVQ